MELGLVVIKCVGWQLQTAGVEWDRRNWCVLGLAWGMQQHIFGSVDQKSDVDFMCGGVCSVGLGSIAIESNGVVQLVYRLGNGFDPH